MRQNNQRFRCALQNHRLSLSTAFILLFAPLYLHGQHSNLEVAATDFDVKRADLQAQMESQSRLLQKKYITAVERLGGEYGTTGNLDGVLATKKEIARFSGNPVVRSGDVNGSIEGVARLQQAYIAQLKKLKQAMDQEVLNVYGNYIKLLERVERDLTRQGMITKAVAAKQQRDAIRKDPLLVAALRARSTAAKDNASSRPPIRNGVADNKGEPIVLPHTAAVLRGKTRIENGGIYYWVGDESYAEWQLHGISPGKYTVEITYANAYSSMGMILQSVRNTSSSRIKRNRARIDGNKANVLRYTVIDTGSSLDFKTFVAGELYLSPLQKLQVFKDPDVGGYSSPFVQKFTLTPVSGPK